MHWLSNPKVRLALIVNGIYFISLLTPTTPQAPPRLFARAFENKDVSVTTPKSAVVFPRLPSSSGPSRAATWVNKSFDQLDVYLKDDLTLVERPGYRLQLSPTFTTVASSPEAPPTVLLRFVSYSDRQVDIAASRVTITADGVNLWDETPGIRYGGDAAQQSYTEEEGREVVKTRGINLPYGVFFGLLNSRKVYIRFGPDLVTLTPAQIEALRDMHRCLPQSPDSPPPPVPTVNTEKKQISGRVSKNQ